MAPCIFADLQTVACNEQQISMVLAYASWRRSRRRLRRQYQWNDNHDMNQKCLTCSSKRSCVSMLRFLFSGCLIECFVVFNIFLGHESASWSWFCAFQGLWNLTPSSAAIQPNKPRMFMTILICLSWFAQIWSYTGYTLWIEFTARFRTTWNDEIDVLCQDRSWESLANSEGLVWEFWEGVLSNKEKWRCIAFTNSNLLDGRTPCH